MTNEALGKMWNILKENDFQIDVATKSEIICTSCKNILIKSYNVPCGCRYCYDCLISYLNGEEKFCLGESDHCKIELINMDKNSFIDQDSNVKISRIVVNCPMETCEFKTELGKMADHMRTCDRQPVKCPYNTIGCDNEKIDVDKMRQHLKKENYCHARLLMDFVDNWRNEMKYLKTNMLDLQKENKCVKEQLESNQKTILALEENVARLLKENTSLKELETEKSRQRNQIEEIILAIQTKTEEQEQGIKTNTEKIEDSKQIFDVKCNQIEKNQEQMKIRIDKMSKENADIATQSKKIETKLTQAQANQNYGEFLWCIKNWKEKKEHALKGIEREIYSDSFYSHENGYKICLKLYIVDLGLCLGICIMRGRFDNILPWPFRHEMKLDLLNQETGLEHLSINLCSQDNPKHKAWKKPINNRNIAYFNNYYFIELSKLSSNPALCQDDQILIKATVDILP